MTEVRTPREIVAEALYVAFSEMSDADAADAILAALADAGLLGYLYLIPDEDGDFWWFDNRKRPKGLIAGDYLRVVAVYDDDVVTSP